MYIELFIVLVIFLAIVHYTSPEKKTDESKVISPSVSPSFWDTTEEIERFIEYVANPPKMPKLESWDEITKELEYLQDQTHMCSDEIEERLRNVDRARFTLKKNNGVTGV